MNITEYNTDVLVLKKSKLKARLFFFCVTIVCAMLIYPASQTLSVTCLNKHDDKFSCTIQYRLGHLELERKEIADVTKAVFLENGYGGRLALASGKGKISITTALGSTDLIMHAIAVFNSKILQKSPETYELPPVFSLLYILGFSVLGIVSLLISMALRSETIAFLKESRRVSIKRFSFFSYTEQIVKFDAIESVDYKKSEDPTGEDCEWYALSLRLKDNEMVGLTSTCEASEAEYLSLQATISHFIGLTNTANETAISSKNNTVFTWLFYAGLFFVIYAVAKSYY